MKRNLLTAAMLFAVSGLWALAQTTTSADTEAQRDAEILSELRSLRAELRAQQAEIEALKAALALKNAPAATTAAQPQPAAVAESAPSPEDSAAVEPNVAATAHTEAPDSIMRAPAAKTEPNPIVPGSIRYKGVELIPGGYIAAESVVRSRAMNADVNTPFNATPYMNAGQAHTSEFNASARQSRLSLLAAAHAPFGQLRAFYEMDFLGAGTTSNNNQSNSYVLRQRQLWAELTRNNGFTLTAGQTWSLVTEDGFALAAGSENSPHTIDAEYHVGFSWARQYGVRAAQRLGAATIGLALEEPQTVNYTSLNAPPDFFVGGLGASGGLYNFSNRYSSNLAPDIIAKAALDPGHGHYELGGVVRFFRSRIYPNQTSASASASGAYNATVAGGGIFANARVPFGHRVELGLHAMAGDGVNRYGSAQLPDVTVHANGTLEPLRGAQGLFSLDVHPNRRLDLYGYAGTEYAQRTYYSAAGTFYGYAPPVLDVSGCFSEQATSAPGSGSAGSVFGGAPYDPSASCGAQTRDIAQGTAGFTYRFYDEPGRGRFQFSLQYSYLTRTAWAGLLSGTYGTPSAIFAAPHATNNMVFTSFRYYLP